MKAVAVFPVRREVALIEHPEPHIESPGRVKLRLIEVGVCGTDRDLCRFKFGSSPPGFDHFVLGHESLGEVVDTSPGVTALQPGDLAVAMVRKPCTAPGCAACRSGHADFCATGTYRERGIQDFHGFMTEFVVEEERYVYSVPRALRDVAVLTEPLTIAEKAFQEFGVIERRLAWPKGTRTALIIGSGPVGLLGAMLFQNAGFATWVYSRESTSDPKAGIVRSIGARYVSSSEEPVDKLASTTGNIDVVYEAMGAPQTAFDVLRYLGANGVFIFTGVPPLAESISLDFHGWMRSMIVKNQVVMGTVNAGREAFAAAIRDLTTFERRWPREVRAMITGRYPIEEFRQAIFEAAGIKNVIAM